MLRKAWAGSLVQPTAQLLMLGKLQQPLRSQAWKASQSREFFLMEFAMRETMTSCV